MGWLKKNWLIILAALAFSVGAVWTVHDKRKKQDILDQEMDCVWSVLKSLRDRQEVIELEQTALKGLIEDYQESDEIAECRAHLALCSGEVDMCSRELEECYGGMESK